MRMILKLLASLIFIFFLLFGFLISRIYFFSNSDEAQTAEAIVVLGASQWNGKPSPLFKSRLDHALFLYRDNISQKIILTGGISKNEKISESQVGKTYLKNRGVPDRDIFIEEVGRTSLQSLKEVVKILNYSNLESVILVSDGFHEMRLKKMAKDLGIAAFSSPVADGPLKNNKMAEFKYVLREGVVYILYLLFDV